MPKNKDYLIIKVITVPLWRELLYSLLRLNQTVVSLEYKNTAGSIFTFMPPSENLGFTQSIFQDIWENPEFIAQLQYTPIFLCVKEHTLDFKSLRGRDGFPISHSQHCHCCLPEICPQPACDRELETAPCSHRKLSWEINYLWHNTIESVSEVNP